MPAHLLYGMVRLPLWGYAALTFTLVQLMFLGVTLYLHRDQSDGGVILHPLPGISSASGCDCARAL